MITSLEIKRLRGIAEGRIDGLKNVTVFLGQNGSGKSTVLEAACLACAGGAAGPSIAAFSSREWLGFEGMRFWFDMTEGGEVVARIEHAAGRTDLTVTIQQLQPLQPDLLVAARGGGDAGRLECVRTHASKSVLVDQSWKVTTLVGWALINEDGESLWHSPGKWELPFAFQGAFAERPAGARRRMSESRFSSALRNSLTSIKLSPWFDDFLMYLQHLRPQIASIESLAMGERDEPFVIEKGARRYPLAYAGDGFRRSLIVAATLASAKGGVAALDEPETFAHPTMMPMLMKLFRRAAADGTQVLVATHSLEFVTALLDEFETSIDQVAVVGLRALNGKLDPIVLSGADASRRAIKLGDDLRL